MSWRVARSLNLLLEEVNASAPHRSKRSDGSIGDRRHASRVSDHNPVNGIVHARDFTHDPAGGFNAHVFAEWMRQQGDERVKYIISNGWIASYYASGGARPWTRRIYRGLNAHTLHTHVSVREYPFADSVIPWGWAEEISPPPPPPVVHLEGIEVDLPLVRIGDIGNGARKVQGLLLAAYHDTIKVDGIFGPVTETHVKNFQEHRGLVPDGIVGKNTWRKLIGG